MNGDTSVPVHSANMINGPAAEPDAAAAYQNNLKAHQVGMSTNDVISAYDAWADKYDKDLCPGVYNGPVIAAKFLSEIYKDSKSREEVKILDVAAGTGRVGVELHTLGFRTMDALEPSMEMREICRTREIYSSLWDDIVTEEHTSIPADNYEVVVVAGGMGEGHIPVKGIVEMIRLLKTAGLLCIVMREEYLQTVEEYAGKLEPFLESLVEKGAIEKVSRTVVPNYSFNKNGVVYIYKKVVKTAV